MTQSAGTKKFRNPQEPFRQVWIGSRMKQQRRTPNGPRYRPLQALLLAGAVLTMVAACAQRISSDVITPLAEETRSRIDQALLLTAWEKPTNPNDFRTCIASAQELDEFVGAELKPADSAQEALLQRFSPPPQPLALLTDPRATALFRKSLANRREALAEIAGLMRPSGVSDALIVLVEPQITCRIVLAQQAGPVVPPSQQRHTVDIATTSELVNLNTQATLYKAIDRGRRGKEIQLANLRSAESLRSELNAQYVALANQIHRQLSGQ